MPYLRPATVADALDLSLNLRLEDEAEVRTVTGDEPVRSLIHGVKHSDMPVAILDNNDSVLALFGVVPVLEKPKTGTVWLLAAPGILKYKRRFARESRQWLEAIQAQYDVLCNLVDERNTVHLRWLQWCGFTFINRHQVNGHPFLEFVRIKTHV